MARPGGESADHAAPGPARVLAVHRNARHALHKCPEAAIDLVAGHGVQGDAHFGTTVQHRSRVAANPHTPNLRQVHLLHSELLDALRAKGFRLDAGMLGENITTEGVDLLGLPRGTRLQLGRQAVIEITGLRNPCRQLDHFQPGLMQAVLDRDAAGHLIRKAGVMAIVIKSGRVHEQDRIKIRRPSGTPQALEPV